MPSLVIRLAAAIGLLVVLALPPAGASAADTKKKTFTVDVTAIQVNDWEYRHPSYPSRCNTWSKGAGTQTIGFSTRRPVRYSVLQVTGRLPAGMPASMPRFTWLATGLGRAKFKGTVERKGEWEDHAIPPTAECTPCGPRSEYGECGTEPPPLAQLWRCGRKALPAVQATVTYQGTGEGGSGSGDDDLLASLTDRLLVQVGASSQGQYDHCPPEFDGSNRKLRYESFPDHVSIAGAKVKRLKRLAVGRKVTLKGQVERGYVADLRGQRESDSCTDGVVAGYKECAITDVTVEIRRTR